MRVLMIADPILPVPPAGYGGTERIVDTLCRELANRGHSVTLMARHDSHVNGKLVAHKAPNNHSPISRAYTKLSFFLKSVAEARPADLIHNFGRLDYLTALLNFTTKPIVTTFQNAVTNADLAWTNKQTRERVHFVSISNAQRPAQAPHSRWTTIYNSVDTSRLAFRSSNASESYLAFLGRLTPAKGVHLAIQTVLKTGHRLKIGGVIAKEPGCQQYFDELVKPHLGRQIEWIGEVTEPMKAEFLGGASGLLFPIQWDEPFGIVMAESLSCGTPVIACSKGAAPEVISHGETGFLAKTNDELPGLVNRLWAISRHACRASAVERFDNKTMASKYLDTYLATTKGP